MAESAAPRVDAFLLGAPKCGTTWLSEVLLQHPGVCISNPKEPNMIATHKGTFPRDVTKPDWSAYSDCFEEDGVRIDCSVHAFACPEAPSRVADFAPNAKMIVCLREPVSRTVSHWNMILDTDEDKKNGADWDDFRVAWADNRLSCDTLYGTSISRWLEFFDLSSILIIEANRMRHSPQDVLNQVCAHIGVGSYVFDLGAVHNANTASDRRPITALGRFFRFAAGLLPKFVKRPIVKWLQSRGTNVYKLPLLSRKAPPKRHISAEQRNLLAQEVNDDLVLLEELTNFDTSKWVIDA
tara:strand:+ start:348 stop:1235 length:888 start_codon:yes stop_codon:yes gene_type:complete